MRLVSLEEQGGRDWLLVGFPRWRMETRGLVLLAHEKVSGVLGEVHGQWEMLTIHFSRLPPPSLLPS